MGAFNLESSSSPLLFLHRNFVTPLLLSADKSLISLTQKSKLLELLRQLLVAVFLVVLNVVQSLPLPLPFRFDVGRRRNERGIVTYHESNTSKQLASRRSVSNGLYNDTPIARAINQLLTLVNDVPVSSRKYEVVRCLAEKLIDENLKEGSEALREVNCTVLSQAFGRALFQLEADLLGQENDGGFGPGFGIGLGRVMRVVKGWRRVKEGVGQGEPNTMLAEKAAAELLWLAQKLEASGGGKVAVEKWAWTSNLGWLGLAADPRVQASLVKLTAFLIKKANDMGKEQRHSGEETEQQKQTKMKMLLTWIPLLCQASNGTDAPTLSISERGEIERAMEEIIDTLEDVENQEKVLSVWLHHFTQCPSSDWPNLYGSYIRWCTVCRKLLLTQ